MFRNKDDKNIIIIFLAALSLRMLLFIAVAPWDDYLAKEMNMAYDDTLQYHISAVKISQGDPMITVYDHPIYINLIALLYAMFGPKPYTAIIFQILLGSLSCVFLYKITNNIFDKKTALIAGLFLAFEYLNIMSNNRLLSDTMFIFLFIIHIYFFQKFLLRKNLKDLLYSALFLGLSTHVRSIGLYFLIFLAWPIFLYFRNNLRKGISSFLILTAVFLLIVIPWMVRNYVVAGEFLLSYDQEKALVWVIPNTMKVIAPGYNAPKNWTAEEKRMIAEEAEKPGMGIPAVVRKYGVHANQVVYWQELLREGKPLPVPKVNEVSQPIEEDYEVSPEKLIKAVSADAINNIKGVFVLLGVLDSRAYPQILGLPSSSLDFKIWHTGFLNVVRTVIKKKSNIELFIVFFSIVFLFYLYSTTCYGIYAAVKKKEFIKVSLFISVILYFILTSAGPVYNSAILGRYRLPIMPYVILISSYGVTEIARRFKTAGDSQTLRG